MDNVKESIEIGFGLAVGYELGKKTVKKAEELYSNFKSNNSKENVKND